ncbi:MAG: TRAP transporter small permease subunit [Pseudomonadales bacterium]|jgi:TRAP-type mannitol/chloroaromatic compound transport system permease small subunit|nr:TRAP transporter small permease subunit [Pseudomonadales bacterium]
MGFLIRAIDALTETTGRLVSWLVLAMMAVTCVVVILRYGFSTGSIALQESVIYLHGMVFMLGIPYALKHDGHVRVDVLYGRMSGRQRDWVNLIGHLVFLLPLAGFILYVSWDYTLRAWRIREGSQEVGGIPAVFLLKTLTPLLAITLALQGLAEIGRTVLRLTGRS